MDPIVSPLIFYLIDLISNIKGFATLFFVISVCGLFISFFTMLTNDPFLPAEKRTYHLSQKGLRYCAIALGISTLLMVVLPEDVTMYKMLAASYVTPDNIETVQDHVVDIVTKIAEGIAKARK